MTTLFEELKRRNVIRMAAFYLALSWLVLQVGDILFEVMGVPDWGLKLLVAMLLLGFPVTLMMAWVFEITPQGIKRESHVDRSRSITPETGRRLNVMTIVVLITVGALVVIDRMSPPGTLAERESAPVEQPGEAVAPNALAAEPDQPVIAVLPLTARSLQGDGSFLADGIHDDLLTQLAKLDAFRVVSRTSVLQYRETAKTIPEIGAEVGATAILEGGLQQAAGRVRINAQLIEVETDTHLWSETFERELTPENIFRIQAEIATAIATALDATLSEGDEIVLAEIPTSNQLAYEAFLRGRLLTRDIDPGPLRSSIMEFERAVELDPEFAEAWAYLGFARILNGWFEGASLAGLAMAEKGLVDIARARELKPDLPQAAYGEAYFYYYFKSDYERALSLINPLVEAYPSDVDYRSTKAWVSRRAGRWEDALGAMRRATELDPVNPFFVEQLAQFNAQVGRYEQARELLERAVTLGLDTEQYLRTLATLDLFEGRVDSLDHDGICIRGTNARVPCRGLYHFMRGEYAAAAEFLPATAPGPEAGRPTNGSWHIQALWLAGDERVEAVALEGRALLRAYLVDDPNDWVASWLLSWFELALGNRESAVEAREAALRLLRPDAVAESTLIADSAAFYSLAGDGERALELLTETLGRPDGYSWPLAELDPRLDSLRELPGYRALNERYGGD